MFRRFLPIAALLAGCSSPAPMTAGMVSNSGPMGGGALISDTASPEDSMVRDTLVRPVSLKFPVRLGVLCYGFNSTLKAEDQTAGLNKVRDQLIAAGQAKSAVVIPATLLESQPSLSSLRKLAARFQVDVLLVLSGSSSLQMADNQPTSFWDSFGNKGWYEGRSALQGLVVDIATGLFIGSFQAAGQDGPVQADRTSAFQTTTYPLVQNAEARALDVVRQRLADALNAVKTNQGAGS
jgi:hypothetical protein